MTLLQKIELALFLGLFWALSGCHSLTPAQTAKLDKFECEVAALRPYVEPALDAAELLRDVYKGSADLGRVLGTLDTTQAEATALLKALHACAPRAELPEGEQSSIVAPPPAYGNKVL